MQIINLLALAVGCLALPAPAAALAVAPLPAPHVAPVEPIVVAEPLGRPLRNPTPVPERVLQELGDENPLVLQRARQDAQTFEAEQQFAEGDRLRAEISVAQAAEVIEKDEVRKETVTRDVLVFGGVSMLAQVPSLLIQAFQPPPEGNNGTEIHFVPVSDEQLNAQMGLDPSGKDPKGAADNAPVNATTTSNSTNVSNANARKVNGTANSTVPSTSKAAKDSSAPLAKIALSTIPTSSAAVAKPTNNATETATSK